MPRSISVAAVLAVAAAGCGPFGDGIDGSLPGLEEAVTRSAETGEPFRLASVTDFEWDRVHVFGAYTTPVQIERALGFRWDEAESSDSQDNDRFVLVAFVRDGRVVRAFDHAQGPAFLVCLTGHALKRNGLTPEEAVLRTERVAGAAPDPYDVVLPAHALSAGQERGARNCLRLFY